MIDSSAPNVRIDLEWVHGYTSHRSAANTRVSNNLVYNADRQVVYHTAALGVVLSRRIDEATGGGTVQLPSEHKQMYFTGHDDDILSFAVSTDR